MDRSFTRQIVQIVCSVLLLIGLFLPVLALKYYGSLGLFSQDSSLAIIILILAIISAILAIRTATTWVPLLGALALVLVLWGLTSTVATVRDARANPAGAPKPPSFYLSDRPAHADVEPGLRWGWAMLLIGACGLATSFLIPATTETRAAVRTGPGRYRVTGFEHDTGRATSTYINADSLEDAEAKAVQDGIIVTEAVFEPIRKDPLARVRGDEH